MNETGERVTHAPSEVTNIYTAALGHEFLGVERSRTVIIIIVAGRRTYAVDTETIVLYIHTRDAFRSGTTIWNAKSSVRANNIRQTNFVRGFVVAALWWFSLAPD